MVKIYIRDVTIPLFAYYINKDVVLLQTKALETEENKFVIYQTEDGQTQIDVRLENETVWLTQAQMAELFQTDRTTIVRHINNIYKVEELDRDSTCAKIAQVQIEGKRTVKRNIPFFNLDMIISVGYRVNSKRGVKFRQWANSVLKDYLVKGGGS